MPEIVVAISRTYAAGDDLTLEFTVTDADGDAVNITGFTAKFAMARRVGDTAVLSTEDSPATATASLTSPASGIYTIAIDKDDTEDLRGTYYFESDVVDGSGDESTVARGYLTFKQTQL